MYFFPLTPCFPLLGMVQKYLPGVALSMFRAIHVAYEAAEWSGLGIPEPYQLGLRTAEVLQYKKTGRLGLHRDSESLLSISVALSHEDDYEGGFFHLRDENVLFKVPRLGAMVFFSESDHGISPVHGGDRKTFVMELWDEDDVPLGTPRPGPGDFHEYQDVRKAELGIGSNADVPDDANEESEAHEEL
jgi:2OG-Fe(II) oxygenase superfamily